MAGSYTKKEIGAGPEEQTLLKDSSGIRIVPAKGMSYFLSKKKFFYCMITMFIILSL